MSSLGRNVLTTYVARFSNVVGLFFLFPLVAHRVSQDEYGVYLLAASLATLFTLDLGMAGSTTRYVAAANAQGDPQELRNVLSTSYMFFFFIGTLGAVAVALTFALSWDSLELPPELVETALVCASLSAVQVVVGSALTPHRLCLAGIGRLDLANGLQVLQIVVRIVGTVVVLAFNADIVLVAVVDVTAVSTVGLLSWLCRRRKCPESNSSLRSARFRQFKSMFALTRDMLVVSLASIIILQSGNVIVGIALGPTSVALFAAAQRVYQVARELTNSLTAALLPAATENHVRGISDRNAQIYVLGTRYSNALLLATLPPAVGTMPSLVTLWLGPSYLDAAVPAMILVASMFVNNQHLVAIPVLSGKADLRGYSVLHGLWAATATLIGVILTDQWGIIGMVVAISAPILLLEPFYVKMAIRSLRVPLSTYWRSAVLMPAAPAAVLILPLVVVVTCTPSSALMSLLTCVTWCVSYLVIFLFWAVPASERKTALDRIRRSRRT